MNYHTGTPVLECKNCEQAQRQFYCEQCLRNHLRDYRNAIDRVTEERDGHVAKAQHTLDATEPGRQRRAQLTMVQARVDDIRRNLIIVREKNETSREQLASLRSTIYTRKQMLVQASLSAAPSRAVPSLPVASAMKPTATLPPAPTPEMLRCTQALASLQDALTRARSGLVQELVEVFSIVEVGGRPPLGGKAGSKGEWTVGGLVLPVPGDIRRYPPTQINAVITHTIHFLGLLTFYLGVKLPFEITWSGGGLGVGQPSISAGKGTELGGWAKWISSNPLHLPLTPTSTSPSNTVPSPSSQGLSGSQSLADLEAQTTSQTPASFTTALAMLLYNVAYLAHTQAVDVPLSQTGEVLRNLWAVCCSGELGRRSHETQPLLSPPTPPTFSLDFSQLLQVTTATPVSRTRPRSRRSSASGVTVPGHVGGKRYSKIVEEDEWEVVDG